MKLSDIKSALLPHEYVNNKSKSIKTVGLLLLFAYVLAFVGMSYAVGSFFNSVYEDVSAFVMSADEFYLSDGVFTFKGENGSCYIESIDSNIMIDTSSSYSDMKEELGGNEYIASAVIASDGFGVAFAGNEVWYSVSELYAMMGEFTFNKALVEEYIGEGENIISNLTVSIGAFVMVAFLPIFAVIILLISLVVRLMRRLTGTRLEFSQLLFVSCGSLIYPLLAVVLLCLFPNSVLFTAVYLFDILRLLTAEVLLYIFLAMYPFFGKKLMVK